MGDYIVRYKHILLDIIGRTLPDCTVYLFGSRATGEYCSGSDIDLAIDAGAKIDFDIIAKMKCDIDNSTIPLEVDIVDLYDAPEGLKKDICREGIVWKN